MRVSLQQEVRPIIPTESCAIQALGQKNVPTQAQETVELCTMLEEEAMLIWQWKEERC